MANEFKVKNGLIVSGSADFEQDLRVRGTLTVDELHTSITTSSIIYESGSTRFGNSSDDIHTFTGSMNITGSISLNGDAIGTGKLDETTFNTYTSSYKVATADFNGLTGSYNSFTTSYISTSSSFDTRIGSLESFSSSLDTSFVNEVEFSNFSSSIKDFTSSVNSFTSSINTTIKDKLNNDGVISGSSQILNGSNIVSSSAQVTTYGFAITGSNTFKGDQYLSGSIIPTIDNAFDLGSPSYQWRDVYISSGSLYIDNTKVLSSTAQELTITTDTGQSIKILEGGTDSIILQTADGDVELKSSGDGDILLDPTNGKIMLKGAVEILNGNKIQSSVGGTPVVFANDIVVSGSIDLTGTIEGIDLTDLSSSINTRVSDLESGAGSLNAFTASTSGRLNSLETESGSVRTNFNSYTSSTDGRLNSIETTTGSIITTNTAQGGRLDSIESKTGSYATTGSNNFFGSQYITGSLTISDNLTVLGSSSIVYSTASQLIVEDNVIVVNSSFPAERFAGLEVHDSGSNGSVTASLFWDGLNNRWIYQNTSEAHYGGGMFIAGPRNTGSLGDEPGLTNGTIPKSIGGDHIGDSIISEFSGSIAINGGLIITGSILSTVSPLVSGSSQVSFNGITDKPTLVSGSSQISFNSISDKPTLVSGSSQISFNTISDKPTLVSGSSQISFNSITDKPTLVSGSSQIDLTETTNYSSGIKTRLNAENVISGSSQVTSIGNSQLTNSSFHVGTTSISLGRTSATQTLTGVSIDGNAATVTNGVYTSGDQTIAGAKTFSGNILFGSTTRQMITLWGSVYGIGVQSGTQYYRADDNFAWFRDGVHSDTAFDPGSGGTLAMKLDSSSNLTVTGTISASNLSGTNTGDQTNITGNAGTVTNGVYTTGDQTIGGTKTFANVKGSSYFDAQANSGFRIRNSADSANAGGFTRRGLWEGNSNYDVAIWAETGYGVYLYSNGSATPRITIDTSGNTNVSGYLGVGQSPNTSYRIITAGDIYLNGNANGWAEGTWKQRRGGGTFYDVLDTNSYSSYALPLGGGTVSGEIVTSYTNGINTVNGGSGYAIYRAYGNSNGVEVQLGAHQTSGYGTVGTYSASNFGIKTSNVLRAYWDTSGHLLPNANGTYNLGSSSARWNTVFTSDLSMSNGIGDYTIVEGEEDLFIYNNKTNKVFKFLLQEVDPAIAPAKKI